MTLNGTQIHSIEVARLLGQTHQKVKQKIDSLRGKLTGFNPDGYDLTRNECQSLLQSYADGGRLDNQVLFEAANQFGVKVVFGSTETLPPVTPIPPKPEPEKTKPIPQPKAEVTPTKKTKWTLETVLPILPLPTLGLAASYGVYHFASQFVPVWVALIEATGFEATYIGLAVSTGLPESLRKRVRAVSWGAVSVSVIYNSLSGALWLNPTLLTGLNSFWVGIVAVVHGAPLAILAYFVADLILHRRK